MDKYQPMRPFPLFVRSLFFQTSILYKTVSFCNNLKNGNRNWTGTEKGSMKIVKSVRIVSCGRQQRRILK